MGFFSKLKEFFSEENIFPEIKKLTITELESWLDSHTEAIFDTASEEIKNIRTAIAQEKRQLSINLSNLEKAELKNNMIPARVKHIMQGNREIYLQRMKDNKIFRLNGLKHKTKELQSKIRRREEKKKESSHIREKLESKKTEIENKENKIESLKI